MASQAASDASSSGQQQQEQQPAAADDPIVQWVVLRRDLWTDIGWPLGPVIAQACHASSAAMFTHLDDPLTQQYIAQENIDHMHKVVLEVKSEQQLVNFSKKLEQEGILHKLWIEQPENYPTCLATKPYRRSQAAPVFKKLQLCKAALAK
uniref:peptidyl-tRNA hydrolase n=1 Tax=Tetradesmus obliquus TaxID=3088 RepID=A0A383V2W8_TETOB|eukprot:jgi/Sobl393_1/2941/SZX59431.1